MYNLSRNCVVYVGLCRTAPSTGKTTTRTGQTREDTHDVNYPATASPGAAQTVRANVISFSPENGEIGETSVWDRVQTQTVEEGTQ